MNEHDIVVVRVQATKGYDKALWRRLCSMGNKKRVNKFSGGVLTSRAKKKPHMNEA